MPLTVGGGVASLEDVRTLLRAGADKVSLNTAAVGAPALIREAADALRQPVHRGRDRRQAPRERRPGTFEVYTHGGRRPTGRDAVAWAREAVDLGAGEILLTSMDRDGTRDGYDLELTRAIAEAVSVPVIASGGAGTLAHLHDGLVPGRADAVARGLDLPLRRAQRAGGQALPPGAGGADPARGGAGVTAAPALQFDAKRPHPGRRPGRGDRRGPHGRVDERGGPRAHARDPADPLLVPVPPGALAEGRDVGPPPARRRRLRGLRRGHAPGPRAPGRGRLPHGEPHVLLRPPRPAAGPRRSRPAPPGPAGNPRRGRARHPIEAGTPREGSYVSGLLAGGDARIAQKVGEEAAEVMVAALAENSERLVAEVADLWFHTLVLMGARGFRPATCSRSCAAGTGRPTGCPRATAPPALSGGLSDARAPGRVAPEAAGDDGAGHRARRLRRGPSSGRDLRGRAEGVSRGRPGRLDTDRQRSGPGAPARGRRGRADGPRDLRGQDPGAPASRARPAPPLRPPGRARSSSRRR